MYTVENLFNDIEKYLEEKFNYSKQKKNEGPDIDYPEADSYWIGRSTSYVESKRDLKKLKKKYYDQNNISGNSNTIITDEVSDVKLERKMVNCKNCVYHPVCPSVQTGLCKCRTYKPISKNIQIKAAPGDTVWFTKWYNTPNGEIVSRKIQYISFHGDKMIYHCKDGAFDEDGFGVYAFLSLDAAKIISGMAGGVMND